ncbi:subclass B1 metallo-beta-lactamase [Rufibacter sediminis]|uniref:beta-lactamase n=1 Tax=Rufibacter sediminis TaxID=2762756 RepID=A0ABR6VPV8_9BACT|nr:subclass B1 metallo-beta-lactamase [Rufibacter sediminis]MBC3539237.1 subclass B1 metallo-beta-lactamase [Rufibacter sediminis]
MIKRTLTLVVILGQFLISCHHGTTRTSTPMGTAALKETSDAAQDSIIYQTESLILHRLSDNVYVHTSFLQTESFGKVGCNGMLVINENQAVIFDTPADKASARTLLEVITEKMKSEVKAVVATHFHADCVGGLDMFHEQGIPSYANQKTIEFLIEKKDGSSIPQNTFEQLLTLTVGKEKVYAEFLGEGHTKDNVIGYFPYEKALFGGCLIKETGAGKGNLEDANVAAWPGTVANLKQKYPDAKIVIPGHGKWGGVELLEYTIQLFQ